MSAFAHETEVDHGGGSGEEDTDDQVGSPDRLMDVTSQPRPTATLQIREPGWFQLRGCGNRHCKQLPRNPFPPQTTILFFAIFQVLSRITYNLSENCTRASCRNAEALFLCTVDDTACRRIGQIDSLNMRLQGSARIKSDLIRSLDPLSFICSSAPLKHRIISISSYPDVKGMDICYRASLK